MLHISGPLHKNSMQHGNFIGIHWLMQDGRQGALLVQALVEVVQLRPAGPDGGEDPAAAALGVRLCGLLALRHGLLLQPEQECCAHAVKKALIVFVTVEKSSYVQIV